MIINHLHKFLFIHIHKTAGSSIRNSLLSYVPGSYYLGYDHSFINAIPNFEIYNNYFKFCIVRNPWDRLVSWYFSILNLPKENNLKIYVTKNSKNFSEFLNYCGAIVYEKKNKKRKVLYNNVLLKKNPNLVYPKSIYFNQLEYITDGNGNIGVDYIGRFESLQESWSHICSKLKINIHLRKDKVGTWSNINKNYKQFYNNEDINKVALIYKKDIEAFNYCY